MIAFEQKPTEIGISSIWGIPMRIIGCEGCDQTFLTASQQNFICPCCGCCVLSERSSLQRKEPPELIIPFTVDQNKLRKLYSSLIKGILFPYKSFTVENLLHNTTQLFLPMWLVDSDVDGNWQAETGYDYQVKSSQEYFANGQWQSKEIIETRVRWEPRMGKIHRHYDNVVAPALQKIDKIMEFTGTYSYKTAQPFNIDYLEKAVVQVPNVDPLEVVSNAKSSINKLAAADCSKACKAQHIRNYSIQADYKNLIWTQILLPLFVTYYQDDHNQVHLIYVNGQTGFTSGARFCSQKQGWQIAAIIAGIGLFLLITGFLLMLATTILPPLGIIGTIIIFLSLMVLLSALFPVIYPWQHNRKQKPIDIYTKGN